MSRPRCLKFINLFFPPSSATSTSQSMGQWVIHTLKTMLMLWGYLHVVLEQFLLWICSGTIPSISRINSVTFKKVKQNDFGMHFTKCKQHETERGRGESKNFLLKALFPYRYLSINIVSFPLPYWLSLTLLIFVFSVIDAIYIFLGCWNCSIAITCGQFIS